MKQIIRTKKYVFIHKIFMTWGAAAVAHRADSNSPSLGGTLKAAFGGEKWGTHSTWTFHGCLVGQGGMAYRTRMVGMVEMADAPEQDALLMAHCQAGEGST